MNWDVFSDWTVTKVFPAIKSRNKKAVCVLDRDTYHTEFDEEERRRLTSWSEKKLADAIVR